MKNVKRILEIVSIIYAVIAFELLIFTFMVDDVKLFTLTIVIACSIVSACLMALANRFQ